MAQPHKGPRRQVSTRLPAELADELDGIAEQSGRSLSEVTADLVAEALGRPLPSETLPRPMYRRRRVVSPDQERLIA
jgi:hypothetical protein